MPLCQLLSRTAADPVPARRGGSASLRFASPLSPPLPSPLTANTPLTPSQRPAGAGLRPGRPAPTAPHPSAPIGWLGPRAAGVAVKRRAGGRGVSFALSRALPSRAQPPPRVGGGADDAPRQLLRGVPLPRRRRHGSRLPAASLPVPTRGVAPRGAAFCRAAACRRYPFRG